MTRLHVAVALLAALVAAAPATAATRTQRISEGCECDKEVLEPGTHYVSVCGGISQSVYGT
jgi:hypothetical protein